RIVITLHDLTLHRFGEAPLWRRLAYRLIIRSAVSKAAKIIAGSQAVKDDLIKNYCIDDEKIAVIYHGVSFNGVVKSAGQSENDCRRQRTSRQIFLGQGG
ncbi:MAG: Mannosyltransferase B-like protein, partial [Candidatus Berkelbacteria bacterium Licking1014_2]